MKNQIFFLIAEGLRGFKNSRDGLLAAIFTIAICTAVLGLVSISLQTFYSQFASIEIDRSLRVFVLPSHEDEDSLLNLENKIMQLGFIDSAQLVSKEEAMEEFKKDFNPELLASLPYNPLPPSFIVYPNSHYESAARHESLRNNLQTLEGVETVSQSNIYLAWMEKWKVPVMGSCLLVGLFVLVSLGLIISNSVKLNLYARKKLVDNMKYCGASEIFIVIPFMVEGLFLGLMGSLLGIIFCLLVLSGVEGLLANSFELEYYKPILYVLLLCGLLTSLASFRTVKKFLQLV